MKNLVNNVNKGVLVEDRNRNRKPNEKQVYYAFWLEADSCLEHLWDFPREACYLFTRTEYDRNIRRQANLASRKLFPLGVLNLFAFSKPTVIVKLSFDGDENVTRIPINVLRNVLERWRRNPEDTKKPGILNKVVDKVAEVLK